MQLLMWTIFLAQRCLFQVSLLALLLLLPPLLLLLLLELLLLSSESAGFAAAHCDLSWLPVLL